MITGTIAVLNPSINILRIGRVPPTSFNQYSLELVVYHLKLKADIYEGTQITERDNM